MFTPTNRFHYTQPRDDPWDLCGGEGGGGSGGTGIATNPGGEHSRDSALGLDETGDLLGEAIYLESIGEYAEAQSRFYTVATTASAAESRWLATMHVVTTDVFTNLGSLWIPQLIDSLITADNTYESRVIGKRILACHYLDGNEYSQAIDVCVNLLNSGLTPPDSVLVAIDLVGIQMAAGLVEEGSGLDAVTEQVPSGLRVVSESHGLRLENQLLALLGSDMQQDNGNKEIPASFELYQNYPNPFNPITEIRFDLPEAVPVELKIFNTLGQEVVTLTDDIRPAGTYRLQWDSKNTAGIPVASGVYVYQLKAGNFVDAKKMILIK